MSRKFCSKFVMPALKTKQDNAICLMCSIVWFWYMPNRLTHDKTGFSYWWHIGIWVPDTNNSTKIVIDQSKSKKSLRSHLEVWVIRCFLWSSWISIPNTHRRILWGRIDTFTWEIRNNLEQFMKYAQWWYHINHQIHQIWPRVIFLFQELKRRKFEEGSGTNYLNVQNK